MICEAEIIVRAEVEHVLAIDDDACALRRANSADAVVQALFFQAINFLHKPIKFGHGDSSIFCHCEERSLRQSNPLVILEIASPLAVARARNDIWYFIFII